MSNAPHVHSVEEARANIKRIEHNSSGPGGSGKMAGPPKEAAGGSAANINTGSHEGVPPKTKGADWA